MLLRDGAAIWTKVKRPTQSGWQLEHPLDGAEPLLEPLRVVHPLDADCRAQWLGREVRGARGLIARHASTDGRRQRRRGGPLDGDRDSA
jgi:hypothetical protein